jgi:DNA-3-methyladenine glycosylase II
MSRRIETESDLESGLELLLKLDPRLKEVFKVSGRPPLRKRDGGFRGLSRIVVSQQLSVASAAAMWKRVETSVDQYNN